MIDETTEETASLYVLGMLSAADASQFETELARNAELQELVTDLKDAVGQLALGAPSRRPSGRVRDEIFAAIRSGHASELPSGLPQWVPWALAAGLAIFAGFQSWDKTRIGEELATLRSQDNLSQLRIATLSSKLDGVPESVGSVAWDREKQRGILTLEKLPKLDPSHDYQLWVIDPAYTQPVSGGIVRVDEQGSARLLFTVDVPIRSADKFAVSRERTGGASTAQGPIVLLGQ